MKKNENIKYLTAGLILLSLFFYWLLGYRTNRQDFMPLITVYSILFVSYLLSLWICEKLNFKILFFAGLAFRVLLIFSLPALSNDYFRFIWDGNLLGQGLNPYNHLPVDLIKENTFTNSSFYLQLFNGMGELSQNNYTNYPPLNQVVFWFPSLFTQNISSYIFFYRIVMIASDIGTFFIGRKILKSMGLKSNNIFIYFLNPLVIIEITGNLHFEGLMIFLFVFSFYMIQKKRNLLSSLFLGMSVLIKLVPLIFMPFIVKRTGFKKGAVYTVVVLMTVTVSYLPFLTPDFIEHYTSSLDLYFRKFEFNASIYYIVREIGFHIKGYNIIQSAGPVLSVISAFAIVLFFIFQKSGNTVSFFNSILAGLTVYYLFATTVHPWYITVLLMISVFTKFRYVMVWTYFVFMSYFAYGNDGFSESILLIIIEYLSVFGIFVFEFIKIKHLWRCR